MNDLKLTERGRRGLGYRPGAPCYQAFLDGIEMGRAYEREDRERGEAEDAPVEPSLSEAVRVLSEVPDKLPLDVFTTTEDEPTP